MPPKAPFFLFLVCGCLFGLLGGIGLFICLDVSGTWTQLFGGFTCFALGIVLFHAGL
jgi:hypothetical protein